MASVLVASALALLACAPLARGGDLGFEWAAIGDPGNRAILDEEIPELPIGGRVDFGSVDRRYRMSAFETTNAQVYEFVQAYRPYMSDDEIGSYAGVRFTGLFDNKGLPVYRLVEGSENVGGQLSWDLSAKMANWLHNGKALTEDAFQRGAYDFDAIEAAPNDPAARQRQDGAKVWIPNYDEWAKAAYYDPNRYGEGEAGYWPYPYQLDRPPIGGFPDEGGETNAFNFDIPVEEGSFLEVGAYDQSGPWGLFDVSGGRQEWLEETFFFGSEDDDLDGLTAGSKAGAFDNKLGDAAGRTSVALFLQNGRGFRFASAIPAPSTTAVFVLAASRFLITRRRRPCGSTSFSDRPAC